MHRLPQQIDLSFFRGLALIQVCVGMHDLQLHFDERVSISIESTIGCITGNGTESTYEDLKQAAPFVIDLLNRAIVSAQGTPDGTLHLEFDGGRRFAVYDSNGDYESYVIKHTDRTIVV